MVKTKKILLLLFSFSCFSLFSENFFLNKQLWNHSEPVGIRVMKNSLIFYDGWTENEEKEEGILSSEFGFNVFYGDKNKYLILDCVVSNVYFLNLVKSSRDVSFYYSDWEIEYTESLTNTYQSSGQLMPFFVEKVSDFIIEKDSSGNEIRFLPEKNGLFYLQSNPWAIHETAKEKFIILSPKIYRTKQIKYEKINNIVILNGFVSTSNLHLFEENSRAKNIRISYKNYIFEVSLEDSRNYQVVRLPFFIEPESSETFKIEILDWYEGKKYSDVVISGIYYLNVHF